LAKRRGVRDKQATHILADCNQRKTCHFVAMNMAELMREISNLPAEQQRELAESVEPAIG